MKSFTTTKKWTSFWKNRQADWKVSYADTLNHPHRDMIINALRKVPFRSVFEIGCNAGPNLLRIRKEFPKVLVGGIDANADAIETAQELMPDIKIRLEAATAEDIYYSDKSIDTILTDATLIYVGPLQINKVMKEIARITRNNIVLCEFHSKNPISRLMLWFASGYFAYDYEKLLTKYGFYNIQFQKIPEEVWGFPWGGKGSFGWIITARI